MISIQTSVRSAAAILLVAAGGLAGIAACDNGRSSSLGTGNANVGAGDDSGDGSTSTCAAPEAPDGGFPGYETFANGVVTAPGAHAAFCNAGVTATSYNYASPISLQVGIDSNSYSASSKVDLPAGAVAPTFTLSLAVGEPVPGVYSSSDPSSACGKLTFSYATLPSPPIDCAARVEGNPYACPAGCQSTYTCGIEVDASNGYFPCCVPLAPTFVYQASASTACPSAQPVPTQIGSWTLTLTSVVPFDGDAGYQGTYQTIYVVHGTLTATLQGFADTTDTANVSLSF